MGKSIRGSVEIDNEFSQTINITGLQVGIYKFRVTVTDSNNETAQAEVTVTVIEEPVEPGDDTDKFIWKVPASIKNSL